MCSNACSMYPLGVGVDQEDYARLMQHANIPSDDRYVFKPVKYHTYNSFVS